MRSGEESQLSEDQGRLNIPDRSNIGILGLGRMGYLYAGTIEKVPGADLYAVVDVSEQARARIAAEFNVPHLYDIRTEVLGSEGAVNVGAYQHTPVLLLTRNGAQHDVTPYLMERFGSAYRAQISHFVSSVLNGTSPAVESKDALASIEIGIAATRSQKEGRPVALDEVRQLVS